MSRPIGRYTGVGGLLLAGALAAFGACSSKQNGADPKSAEQHEFTVFITTDLMGTIEPCGCTTDPLGDLARTAELIAQARRGKKAVLYLDGGSLLYSTEKIPDSMVPQEQLKANLVTRVFAEELGASAIGLGPFDLSRGVKEVKPARQAVNVDPKSGVPIEAPKIVEVGGVKVGIFGVVSPALIKKAGVEAKPPAEAARAAVEGLRKQGAQVVFVLAHMPRDQVSELVREVKGIDFAVVGRTEGGATQSPLKVRYEPQQAKDTWLIEPGDRGQAVSRVDVTVRGDGGFSDAVGNERAQVMVEQLDADIAKLKADIAAWEKQENADKSFVAEKREELAELEKDRRGYNDKPVRVPDKGSWFTLTQEVIRKGLACNKKVQDAKQSYDLAVGKANVEAAKSQKPLAAAAGKPSYVGVETCETCHTEQVEFWKKTHHHNAWETLATRHKEFNLACINCHTTGWDEPGGASLARNEDLRDVQCEVCHGPGSLHVEAGGEEKVKTMVLSPTEKRCVTCHSKEHSDTFEFTAYMRNVTGPGHGEALHKKLGPGVTGHELRKAGLEKAGKTIGAGCSK